MILWSLLSPPSSGPVCHPCSVVACKCCSHWGGKGLQVILIPRQSSCPSTMYEVIKSEAGLYTASSQYLIVQGQDTKHRRKGWHTLRLNINAKGTVPVKLCKAYSCQQASALWQVLCYAAVVFSERAHHTNTQLPSTCWLALTL